MATPSFVPPKAVQANAKLGLELRAKLNGKGGTAVGVARARDLSNGRPVSLDTIKRMVGFFARHGAQKPKNMGTAAKPTPFLVAWLLWGGDEGRSWAKSVNAKSLQTSTQVATTGKPMPKTEYQFSQELRASADLEAYVKDNTYEADKLIIGKPFRTMATGRVFDRITGKQKGADITLANLQDAVNVFKSGENINIDWNHDENTPLGRVLDMWLVEDDGYTSVAILPGYSRAMAAKVDLADGALWSSPHIVWAPYHNPRTGELLGQCWFAGLAITPHPAQDYQILDAVKLAQKDPYPPDSVTVSPQDPRSSPMEELDALKAELEALKAEMAKLLADKQELLDKLAAYESEEPSAPPAEAPPEEAPAEDAEALKAELATLRTAVRLSARKEAVEALLAAGKITPAERALAEKAYDAEQDNPEGFKAFTEVFSARPANAAIPAPKGHGGGTGPVANETHAAVLAFMASNKISNYAEAASRLYVERPSLFYKGGK
jgi:hypothetical protein